MKLKDTVIFIIKHQLILALMIGILCINFSEWINDGIYYLTVIITLYQIPVLLSGVASLFSQRHEYEGLLEKSMKSTRVLTIVISIPIMLAVTLPADWLVPFPSSWVYYLTLFSLFYSIGAFITQRVALGIIGGIAQAEEPSIFGEIIRFATAIHFYPVYLTLSRIGSLPLYIRKPIAFITVLAWLGLMSMVLMIFDQ